MLKRSQLRFQVELMPINECKLSICIPLYKCESNIQALYKEIVSNLEPIFNRSFEVIFVDDASPQNDWQTIKAIASTDNRIRCFQLSKNHGQHPAIIAGLSKCRAEWIVVMDGDLQDHPNEIPKLYNMAISQNLKKILARRTNRKDSFLKKFFSKKFYSVLKIMSGAQLDGTVANFGIYHREVILAVLEMGDKIKYFPAMVNWVGFKTSFLDIEHHPRYAGQTSYNTFKLIKLALNIIISFSEKPLKAMVWLGFFISFSSITVAMYFLLIGFFHKSTIPGWASIIVSIWLSTGMLIFCLGIIGIYLGKIFESVKKRPAFIIEDEYGSN